MSMESMKANLKRGWPYLLTTVAIYFPLVMVIDVLREFDFYHFLLSEIFFGGDFQAIFILGPILILLTLYLGWFRGVLEDKGFGDIAAVAAVTALGILTLFISSFIILGLIFSSGF